MSVGLTTPGAPCSLADSIAAKLLTGKMPEILEAISFSLREPQRGPKYLQAKNVRQIPRFSKSRWRSAARKESTPFSNALLNVLLVIPSVRAASLCPNFSHIRRIFRVKVLALASTPYSNCDSSSKPAKNCSSHLLASFPM
ncbi:MAG: hypothetical protein WBD42_05715 [Methylovirgula sp.]